MRYVDLDAVLADPRASALITAAEARRATITGEQNSTERKKLVDSSSSFWKAFRDLFEELETRAKCWYTESENPGADADIDHYRPKSSVRERRDHPGYWWEALNWRNFRLSCHRANRWRHNEAEGQTLGKQDHFPLLAEETRWMTPTEACAEEPALLDPTDADDPKLLTFSADGTVAVAAQYANDQMAAERVEMSRLYMHLDWPAFIEQRLRIYRAVAGRVKEGDDVEDDALAEVASAMQTMKNVSKALIDMTMPRAPYSAAATAYIYMHKDRAWVADNVLPNISPLTP